MVRTVKLASLGTFLGVNNRRERTRLGVTLAGGAKATYQAAADNVDLDAGFIRRRRGISAALAEGCAHSIWGDGGLDGYAVIGGALNRLTLDGDGLAFDELLTGVGPAASFERMPTGSVVWSDGQRIGAIRDGVPGDLAPASPNPAPVVNVVAGSLPAGLYMIAFTRFGAGGEGPPTVAQRHQVPTNSGFVFTGMDADTRAYVSAPDGEILNRVDGDTIVGLSNTGERLDSLLLESTPPGQIVRHYGARLIVARGSMLCWSDPYRYGLWNPGANFIQFPQPVTVVEPCINGVFVCADRTYWLAGDLADTSLQPVLPYGGAPGSGARGKADDALRVFWVSPHGLVIGAPDGSVKAVQESALTFSNAARAATLPRADRGIEQVIYTRQGVEPLTTASRGFVAANIHRKEIVL